MKSVLPERVDAFTSMATESTRSVRFDLRRELVKLQAITELHQPVEMVWHDDKAKGRRIQLAAREGLNHAPGSVEVGEDGRSASSDCRQQVDIAGA